MGVGRVSSKVIQVPAYLFHVVSEKGDGHLWTDSAEVEFGEMTLLTHFSCQLVLLLVLKVFLHMHNRQSLQRLLMRPGQGAKGTRHVRFQLLSELRLEYTFKIVWVN